MKGFAIATGIHLADGYFQMRIDERDTHKLDNKCRVYISCDAMLGGISALVSQTVMGE